MHENNTCKKWSCVPKGHDHLTVGVPDLNTIIQEMGEPNPTPVRIVDGIYWHNPNNVFRDCQCTEHSEDTFCERAQELLSSRSPFGRLKEPTNETSSWKDEKDGAIIFGSSRKRPKLRPDRAGQDTERMVSRTELCDDQHADISNATTSEPQQSVVSPNDSSQSAHSTQATSELTRNIMNLHIHSKQVLIAL